MQHKMVKMNCSIYKEGNKVRAWPFPQAVQDKSGRPAGKIQSHPTAS